jgi:histone deacetylase complex regulatory component SIN3
VFVQYALRKEGAAMFEKMRKRVPPSTWTDILKALHLYAEDVLHDRDLTEMLAAACASPSNDLASAFEEFMVRCAPSPALAAPMP